MTYTQIKIKQEYRDKLLKLAQANNRSMANMVEVLIDQASAQANKDQPPKSERELG